MNAQEIEEFLSDEIDEIVTRYDSQFSTKGIIKVLSMKIKELQKMIKEEEEK